MEKGKRMTRILHRLKGIAKGEAGASMVEYGLMLALIAIICIAGVALIGTNMNTLFNATATTL
jgi:pilus assembly protein Flp/PilA